MADIIAIATGLIVFAGLVLAYRSYAATYDRLSADSVARQTKRTVGRVELIGFRFRGH